MITIVALALGAALAYGVADFFGGVAARRATVFASTTVNYAVAALVLVVVVAMTGGTWSTQTVVSGLIAGVLALIGFLAFFAALAAGPISLVTPVIALLSSAVPVGAALVLGEPLSPLVWLAVALAVVGSVLIGMEHRL
ncbi:MAG TPA: EamA family transporter, partial [Agromyces sp.]